MVKRAYTSIEQQADGRWICQQTTTVAGRYGPVEVRVGQVFTPKTTFAGYDDFTAHLESVAADEPSKSPHGWS